MEIIKHDDKAYGVLRKAPIHRFAERMGMQPNAEHVNMYKQWVGADTIIQTETHFMFCELIPDVDFEIIE
jgi:hypothetical protein